MSTFYLDLEAGSDAANGSSFANRWKTFASGATAARIAPGDVIRVMASPDPTSLGQSATWTQNSRTVTLTSAVTANIDTCESNWTASTNVTCSLNGGSKEGSNAVQFLIASAFTTGKVAYRATGALDLSAYQQVSFWYMPPTNVANSIKLKLCSDTTGDVPVHTIDLGAYTTLNVWHVITWDNGGALSSGINSIAMYADVDPGSGFAGMLDCIIACKASSAADSLTLDSLIAKVHVMAWAASTAYSLNDQRTPTTANKNGFVYKVTTAGTTGSSEPAWPEAIGATVTDGSVVWTCYDVQDTWYPIRSINGTTVILDAMNATGTSGRGYAGATETVATYKREPIRLTPTTSDTCPATDSGTTDSPITYSGGWNRTDMSTQGSDSETWISGRWHNTSNGNFIGQNVQLNYNEFHHLSGVRFNNGFFWRQGYGIKLRNCWFHACNSGYAQPALATLNLSIKGGGALGCQTLGMQYTSSIVDAKQLRVEGTWGFGNPGVTAPNTTSPWCRITIANAYLRNNAGWGFVTQGSGEIVLRNVGFGNNGSGGIQDPMGQVRGTDCDFTNESTPIDTSKTTTQELYTKISRWNKTADDHRINVDGGWIKSTTSQRNTASGIAWVFNPTSTVRGSGDPMKLKIGKIFCASGTSKTCAIWGRRDSTNIKGRFVIPGGQLPGVPEQTITAEPSINTWTQYTAAAFTPTADGVVELEFWVWDGVGTTNSYYIDDLSVV